jgi:neutral ceramidase
MPLLAYHRALPLDLWNCVQAFHNAMAGAFFYLTAFLASSSLLPNGVVGGLQGVNDQYLLGLGEFD